MQSIDGWHGTTKTWSSKYLAAQCHVLPDLNLPLVTAHSDVVLAILRQWRHRKDNCSRLELHGGSTDHVPLVGVKDVQASAVRYRS